MLEPTDDTTTSDTATRDTTANATAPAQPDEVAAGPGTTARKRAPRKRIAKATDPATASGPPPTQAASEASGAHGASGASGAGEPDTALPDTTLPDTAATPAARKRAPRKAVARAAAPAAPTEPVEFSASAEPPAAVAPERTSRRAAKATKKAAAPAVQPAPASGDEPTGAVATAPANPATADPVETSAEDSPRRPARKRTARKATAPAGTVDPARSADTADTSDSAATSTAADSAPPLGELAAPTLAAAGVLFQAPAAEAPKRRRNPRKSAAAGPDVAVATAAADTVLDPDADIDPDAELEAELEADDKDTASDPAAPTADPDDVKEAAIEQANGARRRRRRGRRGRGGRAGDGTDADGADDGTTDDGEDGATDDVVTEGRATGDRATGDRATGDRATDGSATDGSATDFGATDDATDDAGAGDDDGGTAADDSAPTSTSRRRRRRRSGGGSGGGASGSTSGDPSGDDPDDPPNTVTHVRETRRSDDDGVRGVRGSTRLEAKRQRRRDGRDTTRRRAPILTESEFLARREAVDRVMAVRQSGERTQIAVLEDGILVEHYVTRATATSYVGNVYLGRVQNVLPSMEAAFVDISKGRNGVLYAGEVNWDVAGLEGKSRAIENAMRPGDTVLVQVTKDPIGHKGARLTSQVSLPGRFLVYVPGGGMTGISRRLPDVERHRLKAILKKIVPEDGGVIVRTAAEGASEEDLTLDVERLTAQWQAIEQAAANTTSAPTLVHGEPDLAIRVVRDVFNEDFTSMVVQGEQAWPTISQYVEGVAADLSSRVRLHTSERDLFAELRVDEQLTKALDRKVFLPSGGSLVIDRTEAMTVVDVNTGKFVGAGGNLEQTVTRNNIEAAEEIVRQLRLRDVGGIVVIDFIDMVLESNRDLVLRRLTECLGRDRTKHQVAEVTSLGLVQMTRKRVGEGLLEAFSEPCEVCHGRGVIVHSDPVDQSHLSDGSSGEEANGKRGARRRGGRGGGAAAEPAEPLPTASDEQRRAATAAIAAIHRATSAEEAEAAAAEAAAAAQAADAADAADAAAAAAEANAAAAVGADQPGTADQLGTADAAQVSGQHEPSNQHEPSDESHQHEASDQNGASHQHQAAEPSMADRVLQDAIASVSIVELGTAPAPAADGAGSNGAESNGAESNGAESNGAESNGAAPARRRRRGASRPAGPPVGA